MRITTLVLRLGVILTASLTVFAQEIVAPEEWLESIRLARGLDSRKQYTKNVKGRHHHHRLASTRNRNFKLIKRAIEVDTAEDPAMAKLSSDSSSLSSSTSTSSKLRKRAQGFPPSSELEHRATEYDNFRIDAVVGCKGESAC